jgi:hypothetical protein
MQKIAKPEYLYKSEKAPPEVLFREAKDINEWLLLLCRKNEGMAKLAYEILQLAREGKFIPRSYYMQIKDKVSYMQFYHTISKLRRLGLIVKVGKYYYISKRFENILHNWIEKAIQIRSGAVQVEI